MSKRYYIYFTTNPDKSTLYLGLTNNLIRRISEHSLNRGNKKTFAGRYFCYRLIYFKVYSEIQVAIHREEEIKRWNRKKKETLIASQNPEWKILEPV